ncbi:hypothetical protein CR513_18373, partial [Mucuna pruriens]
SWETFKVSITNSTPNGVVSLEMAKGSVLNEEMRKTAQDSVNAMDMEAPLWHRRLSLINEKGLNCLAKNDMLRGLKNAKLEKCSHYMAAK